LFLEYIVISLFLKKKPYIYKEKNLLFFEKSSYIWKSGNLEFSVFFHAIVLEVAVTLITLAAWF